MDDTQKIVSTNASLVQDQPVVDTSVSLPNKEAAPIVSEAPVTDVLKSSETPFKIDEAAKKLGVSEVSDPHREIETIAVKNLSGIQIPQEQVKTSSTKIPQTSYEAKMEEKASKPSDAIHWLAVLAGKFFKVNILNSKPI